MKTTAIDVFQEGQRPAGTEVIWRKVSSALWSLGWVRDASVDR